MHFSSTPGKMMEFSILRGRSLSFLGEFKKIFSSKITGKIPDFYLIAEYTEFTK